MTKNYFAPHKNVAKIFRAPSKIVKYFSYPNHIRSARVPGIKNGLSLRQKIINLWVLLRRCDRRSRSVCIFSFFKYFLQFILEPIQVEGTLVMCKHDLGMYEVT